MGLRTDPSEYMRGISRVMEILREDTGIANPATDYAWAGARAFYGLLENV